MSKTRSVQLFAVLCLISPAALAAAPRERPGIVLVHGFHGSSRDFNAMMRALERECFECLAPTLKPNDCRNGVRQLSSELAEQIDRRYGESRPIVLVGFSLGGLITRDYVQNLAKRSRVRGVFLVSTPNHGTWWGSLAPTRGLKELAVHSQFIEALNARDAAWSGIPVYCYWTPYDLAILPVASCRWSVGENQMIRCPLHPLMISNRTVIADVIAKTERIALPSGV